MCKLVDNYVPRLPVRRGGQRHQRFPRAVRKLMLSKRKAWKRWKAAPNKTNKSVFNTASRQYRKAARLFLANQENNLLQVGSRKFFTHVSHQLHQPQYICSLNTASDLVSDPSSICSVFSEEFSKNFASPKLQSTHPEPHLEPTTSPSIACVNVDIVSVRLVLYQLRCSAAGPDGLPGIFFKTLAYWLAEPLCTVFQQSVHQGKIPDAWRQAKIIPLYKGKGSKTSPSSYRPISLTSIASKLLERIVASQLQDYLSANKLLCQQQHGFVHRRSTATNLLLCDSVIARHMNNKRPCDLFTLDFSRAFDKVSHSVLSTKLINLGIYGKLHKWRSWIFSHTDLNLCHLTVLNRNLHR